MSEHTPGPRSELFNDLLAFYSKSNLTEKEVNIYTCALKRIDFADLDKVKEMVLNRGSKYMPKAIDLINFNLDIIKERKQTVITQNTIKNNEICPFCNDIGLIPTIGHYGNIPTNQFQEKHWFACSCATGSMFMPKYPYYFEKYPDFEIPWDKEKYPKYTDAISDHIHKLKQQWLKENSNNPVSDLVAAPARKWINTVKSEIKCTLDINSVPL